MRQSCLVVVLIALSVSVSAADPFVGTYRLNSAKSKMTGAAAYVEQGLEIVEDGVDLTLTTSGIRTDGSSFTATVMIPMKNGTVRRVDGRQQVDAGVATRTSPNSIDLRLIRDGKETQRITYTLSADGKVLTWTVKGINAQGQQIEGISVFERR